MGYLNYVFSPLFFYSSKNKQASQGKQNVNKTKSPGKHKQTKNNNNNKSPQNKRGFKANKTQKNKPEKKKNALNQLNAQSKRGFKKRLQPKLGGSNHQATLSSNKQRKIMKQFKGANKEVVNKLSTGRLAAYGLDVRKKDKGKGD